MIKISINHLVGFLFLVLLSGCISSKIGGVQSDKTISAFYRPGIVIDGRGADWAGVEFIVVTHESGVSENEANELLPDSTEDLSYRFAVCYDDEALYVAVEVTDDILITDDTTPGETSGKCWKDDAVEVFIDGNFNRAPNARDADGYEFRFGGEFSLALNGAATSSCTGWPDSFGKPGFWSGATNWEKVKLKKNTAYFYEYRIPSKMFGLKKIQAGDRIGFTIGVQDDDNGMGREHALYWSGYAPHCWKDESGWGVVLFAD